MNEEKHESNEEEASEVKQSEDADSEVELVANVIEASKDGDVVKYTIQSKEVCVVFVFLLNASSIFYFKSKILYIPKMYIN